MLLKFKVLFLFLGLSFVETDPMITIDFEDFKNKIETPSEDLRIYNFWATWCLPCIHEMPYFESTVNNSEGTSLVFVSLDDDRRRDRVQAFLEKNEIKTTVWLLSEKEQKDWKRKLKKDWSGAIPATLFVSANGDRHFHTGQLSQEELEGLIEKYQ
ncbi:TlpA family protein disulfide reductase [Cyclobacterium amurskyense]|jgi:thiol-disulfide isomerase/thioredoxin|uniref:Putative thioredoxin family protein n=1 Tax=Cyclobacterium amurskyense TaxID=320787 RepID=A0A0H4PA27_9BACT|nr:TlpA disulfide reductase family protein [Cyclobacterium amurskyense]AKP51039.1 Putative thioredoxin family protein [Cyclobacterium amurskyense]